MGADEEWAVIVLVRCPPLGLNEDVSSNVTQKAQYNVRQYFNHT